MKIHDRKRMKELFGPRLVDRGRSKAEIRVDIVLGLIAMRRAGLLSSVHTDSGYLKIEIPRKHQDDDHVLRPITWPVAAEMVSRFRAELKPARKASAPAAAQKHA